jgi:hypothetical protein
LTRILLLDDDTVRLDALPVLLRIRLPDTVVDTAFTAEAALALLQMALTDSRCFDSSKPMVETTSDRHDRPSS